MSSLDRELENLRKPIPKGIDLTWTETGNTFTPTDTNNPWAQAPAIMAQWIFNRNSTKIAARPLLPEERAIGQTVVAHINAGFVGPELDRALFSIFGREVFSRHAGLINHVKLASIGSVPPLDGLDPTVGVSLATQIGSNQSDRAVLKNHETKMTASSLESYRSEKTSMSDGEINLSVSELEVNIQGAGPNVTPILDEGSLDKIKLAAQAIIKANDDIGLGDQIARESDNMLVSGEVDPLKHTQETEILDDGGSNELDLVFAGDQIQLDNFSLDANNALIGCDEDLAEIAGTPPNQILVPEVELLQQDCDYVDDNGLEEPSLDVKLENKSKEKTLKLESDNEFKIEI